MINWETRPIEVAHLLNPAFGALLIREAVITYAKAAGQSMPFALCFLILPLALHPPTRRALPSTTRSLLPEWLQSHPGIQAMAAERMRRLSPYSREAILFGLQNGLLELDSEGAVTKAKKSVRDPYQAIDVSDPVECRDTARFLGTWFGKVANPALIFTLWGVRP